MRFLLILIFGIFISGSGIAQNSAQVEFDAANDLLEQGNYREALKQYRAIEKNGTVSGPLYLNMGIATVQIDSLGLAKYYFLHAKEFESVQQDAEQALEFVNSQFSRQSAMLPKLPWDRAVDILKRTPGTFGLFVIGYIFLCISLVLIAAKWFNILELPKHKNLIITGFTISVIIIGLSFYVDYVDQRYDEAVLIKEESSVSETPSESATLVSMAYEGYDLTIDHEKSAEQSGWYYIRLGNGQFGWIKEAGIKIL